MKSTASTLARASLTIALTTIGMLPEIGYAQSRPKEPVNRQQAARFGYTPAQAREVQAFIDQNQAYIDRLARENRTSSAALTAIARELSLRNAGADPQRILTELRTRAASAAELQAEVASLRQQVALLQQGSTRSRATELLSAADTSFVRGDLDATQAALVQLPELASRSSNAAFDLRGEAVKTIRRLAALRGDLDELDRIVDAYDAELVARGPGFESERWQNRKFQAETWRDAGLWRGDPAAIEKAITLYGAAAAILPSEAAFAEERAITDQNIANAFNMLGGLTGDDENFESSITYAYRAVRHFLNEPGGTNLNSSYNTIAANLMKLGQSNNDRAQIREAISIFENLASSATRISDPESWGAYQANICNSYKTLGGLEKSVGLYRKAISSCELALQVRTRRVSERDWANSQRMLGSVFLSLGEMTKDIELLQKAERYLEETLDVNTRDTYPLEWFRVNVEIAVAIGLVGQNQKSDILLDKSIERYRRTFSQSPARVNPFDLAGAQQNFAGVLLQRWALLPNRDADHRLLDQMIFAAEQSLLVFRQDTNVLQWARSRSQIATGISLKQTRQRNDRTLLLSAWNMDVEAMRVVRNAGYAAQANQYAHQANLIAEKYESYGYGTLPRQSER